MLKNIIFLFCLLALSCNQLNTDKKEDIVLEGVISSMADVDQGDYNNYDYLYSVLHKTDTLLKLDIKDSSLEECKDQGYFQFSYDIPRVYITAKGNTLFFKSDKKDTLEIVIEKETESNKAIIDFIKKNTSKY